MSPLPRFPRAGRGRALLVLGPLAVVLAALAVVTIKLARSRR